MKRVQDALKAQLTKQNEKLEIELREKAIIIMFLKDLYGVVMLAIVYY